MLLALKPHNRSVTDIPTLYVATTNPGKLRDFATVNTPGVTLLPLPGLDGLPEAPEIEPTFEGNAISKALHYSALAPGLVVLADDSGLEVDSLNGAPGVRSARFADDHNYPTRRLLPAHPQRYVDQRNNLCLLDALASTREDHRQARYLCALAAVLDGALLSTATGTVEGEILAVPRGNRGFGFDPLFLLPDTGLTMAELALDQRHRFSHRSRALASLMANLQHLPLFAQT